MGGAGADIFLPRAGAAKKYLEPEPGKNGTAPQHFTYLNHKISTKLLRFVTFPQETMTKRS